MRQEYTIDIQGLTKNFGAVRAVDGLSLTIAPNQVFGFLGPNGAGKTTTINMICGLFEADSGQISIAGKNGPLAHERPPQIGVCPQELIVWDYLTCEEQLLFAAQMHNVGTREARASIRLLLDQLGLMEKKRKIAKTLSGGLKRRLNLALAVVHDPEIVILDEPDAGLDPQSRILVREFVRALAQNRTVILTTHNMDEADRICDRIAIVDQGKLLVVDTPQNLKCQTIQGNVIEAILEDAGKAPALEKEIRTAFPEAVKEISAMNDRLIVRLLEAERRFPDVMKILTANGVPRENISFRWTTLEDVFVSLTGRSLRE